MTPLLEVKGLSVSFKRYTGLFKQQVVPVVEHLDLKVDAGEIVALIGASGSGKSLLAHAILGILPDHAQMSGSIYYEGVRLTSDKLEKLRGRELAVVPQSVNALDPFMRVEKQIYSANASMAYEEKVGVLERFRLDENVRQLYPHQLSGGMARRVLVATAAMHRPRLVIADEPTPGMQVEDVQETMQSFKDMAKEGSSVLLITHDIEAALTVADRVAIIYAGTVVEQADAAAFSGDGSSLRHPYSKALWNALPMNAFHVSS